MCFEAPWQNFANMASPANLTMLSRTASKFCAHIRAECPEIVVLDLKSYESSGIIGAWSECQLTATAAARQKPSPLSPDPSPSRAGSEYPVRGTSSL